VKPAQPYRVLLLDLDGTIVDYARTEEAALAAVHAEFFRRHVSYPEFRRAFHACNDELWAAYRRHQVDLDILRAERFLRLRAAVGASVAIDVITTRFEAELGRAVVLFRDARPALRALRRAFRLILVTDGIAAVQRAKLATSRLGRFFERVIISSEVGYRKPDPRLLDHALRHAGTRAGNALVVGDSRVSDGSGAMAAGIDFCWVNRSADRPEPASWQATVPVRLHVPDLAALATVLGCRERAQSVMAYLRI